MFISQRSSGSFSYGRVQQEAEMTPRSLGGAIQNDVTYTVIGQFGHMCCYGMYSNRLSVESVHELINVSHFEAVTNYHIFGQV